MFDYICKLVWAARGWRVNAARGWSVNVYANEHGTRCAWLLAKQESVDPGKRKHLYKANASPLIKKYS